MIYGRLCSEGFVIITKPQLEHVEILYNKNLWSQQCWLLKSKHITISCKGFDFLQFQTEDRTLFSDRHSKILLLEILCVCVFRVRRDTMGMILTFLAYFGMNMTNLRFPPFGKAKFKLISLTQLFTRIYGIQKYDT